MKLYKEIFVVAIGYKSGITRTFECTDFSVKTNGSEITSVSWEVANEDEKRPVHIGVANIESVWVVRTRRVFSPSLK